MYLSRIALTSSIGGYSQLGLILKDRSYAMHRLLWDLFPDQSRFLFREESAREQLGVERSLPLYYVLSATAPNSASPIFTVETKPFSPKLNAGDELAFRVRANPTVTRKLEGKAKSQRHDVIMDAQRQFLLNQCAARQIASNSNKSEMRQLLLNHADYAGPKGSERLANELTQAMQTAAEDWLQKRGDKNGFNLVSVQATGYRWNALPEKDRRAGYSSMDYEGVLKVTNAEAFSQMLGNGLGPAKAFGCGLMLIRRV